MYTSTNLKRFRSIQVASFDVVRLAIELRILHLIGIALHEREGGERRGRVRGGEREERGGGE